jgi:hypothetical protein
VFRILLAGCAARGEIADVPGTPIRMQLLRIPGRNRIPDFWMAAREVTWAEFDRFAEFPSDEAQDGITRPSRGKDYVVLSGLPNEFMQPDRPLTNVRYHAAVSYCEWLSRRTGATYRLPTEAEWNLACGEDPSAPAWTKENSDDRTHVGGERKPSSSGVSDLLGNVWEYALEPDQVPEFDPVLLGGAWNESARLRRRRETADWTLADPNRPPSTWWYRAGHSQGVRLVRVSGADEKPARDAAAAKLQFHGLQGVERDKSLYMTVTGKVWNGSDRTLSELILKVYYLNRRSKPHFEDVSSYQPRRATFNLAMPVLVSSGHAGEHANPLRPGESRAFVVDLPLSLDGDDEVHHDQFGVSVLSIRFAD